MGSLSSRVLRPPGRTRAQPEPGSGAGGSARRPEAGGDAAGHGFCYCPSSRKRKRSSGALCYCHPESETDEEEEEGDEQQRLLNTPRRYVEGRARTCWAAPGAGGLAGRRWRGPGAGGSPAEAAQVGSALGGGRRRGRWGFGTTNHRRRPDAVTAPRGDPATPSRSWRLVKPWTRPAGCPTRCTFVFSEWVSVKGAAGHPVALDSTD